ncbi:MAG: alpha/beta hydrolase [Actinobacteria bacterium]|nr:alpha/beta hydrolase [Actinomycetota bacterium]
MPTVTVNGVDLHVERSGSGPRLLHLGGSGTTLETTAPLLKPYAARFDLLAFDYRGMGRSGFPPEPWTMADLAADALALMDDAGWESCRVVGTSFGGMVAMELAVTAPERVERLALLCTSAGGEGGMSFPLHSLVDLPPDERAARYTAILDTRFMPEFLAGDPRSAAIAQILATRIAEERSPEQARGEAAQFAARSGHDVWERLPAIDCPTFVACGRWDGIAPMANAEAIAGRIPDAELRAYDGGHVFFLQDRSAMPDVIAFLSGPPSPT